MSNFQKRQGFSKKGSKFLHSYLYDLIHQKNNAKFVMLIFKYFWRKKFRDFSVNYLGDKWMTKTRKKSPRIIDATAVIMNAANKATTTNIY